MDLIIEQSIVVKASHLELWHALTDADELENWWGDGVVIEAKVGGKFCEKWQDDEGNNQVASGKVLSVKDKKEIKFTWQEKNWPKAAVTECSFLIQEQAANKCMLTVRHTGWETLPEALREQCLKDFKIGWSYHLKELKSYLDE